MNKFIFKLKMLAPSRRKLIQLYFALLFNANLKGFASGRIYQGQTKNICVPGINCYSCPGAVGACPLGSLQGSFSAGRSTVYYVFGILFLYGVLFGRMICGYLCPFGLIGELLHKIKTPKLKKSRVTRTLSYLKYVILVVFVFIIPILYAIKDVPFPSFCKYICPAGTVEGGVLLLSNKLNDSFFSMLGPLFTWKFALMVSILVGSVFVFRLFCRFICPLGALYGLFNRFSVFGVKFDRSKCVDCGRCVTSCKVDIRHVGDAECISCGECIPVCPTNAIAFNGMKWMIPSTDGLDEEKAEAASKKAARRNTVIRYIIGAVMTVFLIVSIVYFANESAPLPEVGVEVGNLCTSYDLEIVNGNGLTGETVDPVATGKITVVNFWGTWCSGCVAELPYFDRIASEYTDEVTVIAVHTNMIHETAPEFITKYYPDSKIVFAKDYDADGTEGYYISVGGRGEYPYTVILDERGVILKTFSSTVEYEDLKELVESELNK